MFCAYPLNDYLVVRYSPRQANGRRWTAGDMKKVWKPHPVLCRSSEVTGLWSMGSPRTRIGDKRWYGSVTSFHLKSFSFWKVTHPSTLQLIFQYFPFICFELVVLLGINQNRSRLTQRRCVHGVRYTPGAHTYEVARYWNIYQLRPEPLPFDNLVNLKLGSSAKSRVNVSMPILSHLISG